MPKRMREVFSLPPIISSFKKKQTMISESKKQNNQPASMQEYTYTLEEDFRCKFEMHCQAAAGENEKIKSSR
jgi:hypothetical protein